MNCVWTSVDGPDNARMFGNVFVYGPDGARMRGNGGVISTIKKNNDVVVIYQSLYHRVHSIIHMLKINGVTLIHVVELNNVTSSNLLETVMDAVVEKHKKNGLLIK